MKSFKIFGIIVLAIMFCSVIPAFAAGSDFNVPQYDKTTVQPETRYWLPQLRKAVSDKKTAEEMKKYYEGMYQVEIYIIICKDYRIDTNNDGVVDMLHEERSVPAFKFPDPSDNSKEISVPAHKQILLHIGPVYNENREIIGFKRTLVDYKKENGEWGADGNFEHEVIN